MNLTLSTSLMVKSAHVALRFPAIAAVLFLSACAAPRPISEARELPKAWSNQASVATATAKAPKRTESVESAPIKFSADWWRVFADPNINELMQETQAGNLDLARSELGLQRIQLLQSLAGRAFDASISASSNRNDSQAFESGTRQQITNYQLNSSARYELDLFGRLQSQRDIARWNTKASVAEHRALELAVASAVLRQYWLLRLQQQQASDLKLDLLSIARVLAIGESRYRNGFGSRESLNSVRAEQISLRNRARALSRAKIETQHALKVLTGLAPETPWPLLANLTSDRLDSVNIPEISTGIPADALANRPELVAAEQRLQVARAEAQLAKSALYPSIALTGNLGSASAGLSQLLDNPIATLSAQLLQPVLQWRTTRNRLTDAQIAYEQAALGFQKTLIEAFLDVEIALGLHAQLAIEARSLQESLLLQRQNEAIALSQYQAGSTDVREWLSAQRSLRGARFELARQQVERLNNYVVLLRVLGLASLRR